MRLRTDRVAKQVRGTIVDPGNPARARSLLPQGDDLFPQPVLLARGSTDSCGLDEEVAFGLIAKLMHQDAKAAGRVTESTGHFGGGDTLHEDGSEGFVLPMRGVGWLQEAASQR